MFSYFSLVNEAFDMALSGLIVIGGLVLVAVLRYLLRRYSNFIVVRERRQCSVTFQPPTDARTSRGAAPGGPQATVQDSGAGRGHPTNSHGGTGEEDQERASDPTPRPVHASAHPDQEVRHAGGFATGVEIL